MVRTISLWLGLCLTALLGGQSIGRFGFHDLPEIPGFEFSAQGFRAKSGLADWLRFEAALTAPKYAAVTDTKAMMTFDRHKGEPSKLEVDLNVPGFRMYFPEGINLSLSSTSSPYLSWREGSVRNDVPTPAEQWLLLSFTQKQPAILLAFEGKAPSMIVDGKPGDWTLRNTDAFSGWVRIGLPCGTKEIDTRSVSALGDLVEKAAAHMKRWTGATPSLQSVQIDDSPLGLRVTWHYDRPGALVPTPVILAPLGGYPLELESRIERLDAYDDDGPLAVTSEPDLVVYFPARRVPLGRFLAFGKPDTFPLSTVSPIDVPSVVELALENLMGTRDPATVKLGESALGGFLDQTTFVTEPVSGQRLPYDSEGQGLDLAASHALLMQSLTTTRKASSDENSLLATVAMRTDWRSWQLWVQKRDIGRRAAALASIAAAMCPEPERRLSGAILQAGLASERGLNTYWKRIDSSHESVPLLETLYGIRQTLYALHGPQEADPFASALLSELRIVGDQNVEVRPSEGSAMLCWTAAGKEPATFSLFSATPLTIEGADNLDGLEVSENFGAFTIRYRAKGPGPCSARISHSTVAKPLPPSCPSPKYVESSW
ncbi:MAG: hypothetical protein JSS72_02540 [Armatimonadetes bacterium]|nr:hypothetical protein [Armatimonadota bacterium]